ncbi:phosphopeptide-binding protein [Mangrovivirga cuniculi]|uniref:Phosphopeptide-binding protein n=1 Tax=Mangrovivirga cuniculi TaxID=2715131 RepID=A0A4D7JF87_9BACT|nr:phosphopeptide-binding protein [Mangrovivirga cuniculi]QCK13377.1 phosphopeptide-binding protein [Mangrovivirga cuniculi]
MMKIRITTICLLAILAVTSCNTKEGSDEESAEDSTAMAEETMTEDAPISISPVTNSPEFNDSMLEMNSPSESAELKPGTVNFNFNVKNYTLASQTPDADIKNCANSDKGQHIHLILNNEPYSAHYDAQFDKEMEEGHYVALAFLSRSYHESLKNPDAYVIRQFTVGDVDAEPADLTQPHMFYSRPKGEYSGANTEKVLLDFYLLNTDLSADGNKVRATINEETFLIDKWQPYFIEGMPMGENTIMLELIDSEGNVVPGPFNTVERTITLTE